MASRKQYEKEREVEKVKGVAKYDNSTYGTDSPDYVAIMVDQSDSPTSLVEPIHHDELDKKNTLITDSGVACETLNICVPNINVPEATLKLTETLIKDDKTGTVTEADKEASKAIAKYADDIDNLPDGSLSTSNPNPLTVGDIAFSNASDLSALGYPTLNKDNLFAFSALAQMTNPLITREGVACRPETELPIPEFTESQERQAEIEDLLAKLRDLIGKENAVIPDPKPIENKELTERITDGSGTFDNMSTALLNQLEYAKNRGLIASDDVAQIYSQSLPQSMQIAAQFTLEKEQVYWANLVAKAQYNQTNVAAMLAQIELLMFPQKVKLAYAQLDAQLKQIDILRYQAEVQKAQIPLVAAQIDQTREQTALICTQNKLALEQLAQAEIDRKLKQAQLDGALFDIETKKQQAQQSAVQTQLQLVQVEQAKEQVKVTNTQWQAGVKQLKLIDVQVKQAQAQIKTMAQQLLRDKEQTHLVKAQTATAYAQLTMTTEQIKAARAQYSDTIDGAEVGGLLGAQISVHKMQAECFDRDSYYKFFSQLQSGWATKKSSDLATLSPNSFTAFGLDRAVNFYATKYFNMPKNTFELPTNYRDYLSDAEMDGEVATPSTDNATVKPKA